MAEQIYVVGFIGTSGSGKSHRATEVAKDLGISYIIDDGILIYHNRVVAGSSAKLAKTRVGSLKRAVFYDEEHREEVRAAIRKYKPQAILVLGTSDNMIEKIVDCLALPPIAKKVYIDEYASQWEQRQAKATRLNKGMHVIPVATFELKKDFSGLLLDPLNWMKWKGKVINNYESERSVVRPTFSMLGNYSITDYTIVQLIKYTILKNKGVQRVARVAVQQYRYGVHIQADIVMYYGQKIKSVMREIQLDIADELEVTTSLYVSAIDMTVVNLVMTQEKSRVR